MARPVTIDTEDILAAAREVFLEKGVNATTAEVARRAGVSEGSIFKRFRTKDELFRASMEGQFQVAPFLEGLQARVGQGEIREQLYEIGLGGIAFFRKLVPMVMMSWSHPPTHLKEANPPALVAIRQMSSYLEAEMRLGRVRRVDPEVLARQFLGALWHHVFLDVLLEIHEVMPMPAESFLRGFLDQLWRGVAPEPSPPSPAGRPATKPAR
jgi:AcrR family transcriptional regulator